MVHLEPEAAFSGSQVAPSNRGDMTEVGSSMLGDVSLMHV